MQELLKKMNYNSLIHNFLITITLCVILVDIFPSVYSAQTQATHTTFGLLVKRGVD